MIGAILGELWGHWFKDFLQRRYVKRHNGMCLSADPVWSSSPAHTALDGPAFCLGALGVCSSCDAAVFPWPGCKAYKSQGCVLVLYNYANDGSEGGNPWPFGNPAFCSGQDGFLASLETKGVINETNFQALAFCQSTTRKDGIDAGLAVGPKLTKLDALVRLWDYYCGIHGRFADYIRSVQVKTVLQHDLVVRNTTRNGDDLFRVPLEYEGDVQVEKMDVSDRIALEEVEQDFLKPVRPFASFVKCQL